MNLEVCSVRGLAVICSKHFRLRDEAAPMTASKPHHFAFFAYSAFCVRSQENHNPDHETIWVTTTDRSTLKIFSSIFEFSIDAICNKL